MSKEAMKLALEALEWCHGGEPCGTAEAITALREALAEQKSGIKQVIELYDSPDQPSPQEPVAFEEWLAKQHGDPEEIGFLQALRIAYIAGQDSITSPTAQRKPLTDEEIVQIELGLRQYNNRDTYDLSLKDFARAIEAAHGIKGDA